MFFCTYPNQPRRGGNSNWLDFLRNARHFAARSVSRAVRGGSRDRPESLGTPERAERIVVDASRVRSALRIRAHGATARACATEIRISSPSRCRLRRSFRPSFLLAGFIIFRPSFFRGEGSVWICFDALKFLEENANIVTITILLHLGWNFALLCYYFHSPLRFLYFRIIMYSN